MRQLTLLQVDPRAAIAANADLVARSRLGSSNDMIHEDVELPRAITNGVQDELEDLATWLGFASIGRP